MNEVRGKSADWWRAKVRELRAQANHHDYMQRFTFAVECREEAAKIEADLLAQGLPLEVVEVHVPVVQLSWWQRLWGGF